MISFFKKPSAWIPIATSLSAIALLVSILAMYGVVHEEDEGTAAHLWQLLIGGQAPIILYFVVRYVPERPTEALRILALQFFAGLAAAFPVFYFQL